MSTSAYSDGALREEREALLIELLAKLGDTRSARARAASFMLRYPHSAYRARLDTLLDPARVR